MWRRIAAIPYEGLLLLALLLIASFPIAGLKGYTLGGTPHLIYQIYLLIVTSAYFVWLWHRGGQTLAMKTWRFKVVDRAGKRLTVVQALRRFIYALIFLAPPQLAWYCCFFRIACGW